MKNIKSIFLASLLGFTLSNSAFAISISGVNVGIYDGLSVGDADIFQSWANLGNSGTSDELAFINTVADPDLLTLTKIESPTYYTTNQINTFAIKFASTDTPEYFMIKNSVYAILFENKPNTGWGVFDLTVLSGYTVPKGNNNTQSLFDAFNVPDTEKWELSHISYAGTATPPCTNPQGCDTQQIPEPDMLALMGIGLLGMAMTYARKRHC